MHKPTASSIAESTKYSGSHQIEHDKNLLHYTIIMLKQQIQWKYVFKWYRLRVFEQTPDILKKEKEKRKEFPSPNHLILKLQEEKSEHSVT